MSGFFSSKPVIGFCVFSSIKYMKSCPFISRFGWYLEEKREIYDTLRPHDLGDLGIISIDDV